MQIPILLKSKQAKIASIFLGGLLIIFFSFKTSLVLKYKALESVTIRDRNDELISVLPNPKGTHGFFLRSIPTRVSKLLIQKEDKYFYFHPGFNPASLLRAIYRYTAGGSAGGSSTITQQLVKNLLDHETKRTLTNKTEELLYAVGLEVFSSKKTILAMYINTVYMGNNVQGLGQASLDYFGKDIGKLNDSEIIMLIATISSPSYSNPWKETNKDASIALSKNLGLEMDYQPVTNKSSHLHNTAESFELETMVKNCQASCSLTIDKKLTEKLRAVLARNIEKTKDAEGRTGAIVVLKEPENEILAIVGSPNPFDLQDGHSINMAIEPRPVGSTIKPFIYLKAFEKGLRPYTLVEDREYKFEVATGFPIYPKNYDGIYHGTVSLHQALSNSLNVPTVKVLEYVGLHPFYDFLENKLLFNPLQDLDEYQYGIALGGLEMDPLTLSLYFSLFPQNGILKPLILRKDSLEPTLPPMSKLDKIINVSEPKYVELVNRILNDRKTGVEQFGLESSLNLSQDNYAVKTGTSRDYHDSWTVGYTPDFVVTVWLGNAENEPLKQLSGQAGAGQIWNEAMEILFNSEYNKKTPFDFRETKNFEIGGSVDFGLPEDLVSLNQKLLKDDRLILSPHDGDTILFETNTAIPLRASREISWYAGNEFLGTGKQVYFKPGNIGKFIIKAVDEENTETIVLNIVSDKANR